MKRCPSCQQTYTDDALSYCPADGTRLENERAAAPAMDLQATIMAPPPPSPPPLSESFGAEEQPLSGYETNVTPSLSGFEPTTPPLQTPSWESLPTAAQQQSFTAPTAPEGAKRPKPMVAYIIIGASIVIAGFLLIIWLIGAVIGIFGGLIHLLLLLALLIGFAGIAVGVFLLLTGKKQ
jgi:hypothetical protein